jgi:hypothetical protein
MSKGLARAALIVGAVAAITTGIGAIVGSGALFGIAGSTFTGIGQVLGAGAALLGVTSSISAKSPSKIPIGTSDSFVSAPFTNFDFRA